MKSFVVAMVVALALLCSGVPGPACQIGPDQQYGVGCAMLDQEQACYRGGLSARSLPGYAVWQSFTAGRSGMLVRLDAGFFGKIDGAGRLEVFAGDGPGGTLLHVRRVRVVSKTDQLNWTEWPVRVPVEAGRSYTFRFTPDIKQMPDPFGVATSSENSYPRGSMGTTDPAGNYRSEGDWAFRTYLR